MFHLRGSSPSTIHSPFLVIPTSMASNLSVSNARSTPAAEMQEIECSSALPPYITTMRCFAIFVLCSISWSVERTRAQHRLPILSVLSVFAISRRFALLFARDTTHSQYRSSVYKPHLKVRSYLQLRCYGKLIFRRKVRTAFARRRCRRKARGSWQWQAAWARHTACRAPLPHRQSARLRPRRCSPW